MAEGTEFVRKSERELVFMRTFDAPRELVWKAWTDPKRIPDWWGPRRYETIVDAMDVRPGGRWRFRNRDTEGNEFAFRGEYREVVPPKRIVQTFVFEGAPRSHMVETATLEEKGGRTTLTIVSVFHGPVEDLEAMIGSGMEEGARETYDRFTELLAALRAAGGAPGTAAKNEAAFAFPSDREVVLTRVFNAPRDRVFKAFSDPRIIPEWWGDNTTVDTMDVRPGGAWRFVSRGPDGKEYGFHGEFREVVPPERIVQTFQAEGMPVQAILQTATFEAQGARTKLTIRQVFASKEDRDLVVRYGMEAGAKKTYDRLEALLAGQATDGKGDLVITRIFDAPRDRVWKAWTDPEQIVRWWGPKEFTAPSATLDLRVGGKWLYCMRGPDGKDIWATGVFKEIVPMQRIVATDSFADERGNVVPSTDYGMEGIPLEMLVTVTFEDLGGKTKLTLRHAGLPAGEHIQGAEIGWNTSLDKLAALVEA